MENPELLKSVGLFAEFDPEELQRLSGLMTSVRFHPGDTILDEGNANRALHVLKSGRIRVTRTVHGGEVALCDLAAGQTFGELSIIEDGVASASLRAVADAEVLSISIGDLASFSGTNRRRQGSSGGPSRSSCGVASSRRMTSSHATSR